jgi:hypothetical protein
MAMRKKGAGVDTSLHSANRAEFGARREGQTPTGAAMPTAPALKSKGATPEPARTFRLRGNHDGLVPRRDAIVAGGRADAVRDDAGVDLVGALDRLLADARIACRREGVPATRRELFARVAKRVGLSQAEVARRLRGQVRLGGVTATPLSRVRRPHDPIPLLATTILGAREREVFLARRDARPDDIDALRQLAARLEISVERVYQLEASARRKLACALG